MVAQPGIGASMLEQDRQYQCLVVGRSCLWVGGQTRAAMRPSTGVGQDEKPCVPFSLVSPAKQNIINLMDALRE
jgi:hypothetical protein